MSSVIWILLPFETGSPGAGTEHDRFLREQQIAFEIKVKPHLAPN